MFKAFAHTAFDRSDRRRNEHVSNARPVMPVLSIPLVSQDQRATTTITVMVIYVLNPVLLVHVVSTRDPTSVSRLHEQGPDSSKESGYLPLSPSLCMSTRQPLSLTHIHSSDSNAIGFLVTSDEAQVSPPRFVSVVHFTTRH